MPKQPQAALDTVYAFSPNRDTLGATAYLIVENRANILIDCPAIDELNLEFLQQQGGVRWLFLTHRGAIGKAEKIQQETGCEIVIQEQEAYLLPELAVKNFSDEFVFSPSCQAIWTPGHSPGSSCLYYAGSGGVLFTGRHLLPNQQGEPVPLRTSKTFHWPRQIRSVQSLIDRFTPATLSYICPGANTGYLRGQRFIDRAYQRLAQIDLEGCRQSQALV
ncbi:MAG: MBL fold metallo-hydrolase [Microcoleus vaginatus WJT46-NPBG5]|jgi:glyoxylase-like metal-dependent hydrolase (beta-lactamase superfamily II)|nr:MBL fold metallo-hydrolase [Microcoleus vaginatus WJT46-NPBG5]